VNDHTDNVTSAWKDGILVTRGQLQLSMGYGPQNETNNAQHANEALHSAAADVHPLCRSL